MSRILVIDDELVLRRMLRSMLERAGHTVFDAPDGPRRHGALAAGADRRRRDRYLYAGKGRRGGHQGDENGMTTPKIIAMSAGGRWGVLDWSATALSLGADRVLVKPFAPEALLSVIQEVLAGVADPIDIVSRSSATE